MGTRHLRRSLTLALILIAFIAIGLIYSIASPIFEASDEAWHYAVIQHIADGFGLPVQQPGVKTTWEQEGSQPPSYYLLMAAATKWIDTRDVLDRMYRNPHAVPGDPSLDANRNLVIHSPAEDFPWQSTALAVHLIRLLSIGLGAITIAMGHGIARRLFPERPSLASGTAMLIAFNPMFLFISASVNNDNLVIALSSVALYLLVICWQEPTRQLIARTGCGGSPWASSLAVPL
jgi:4-amino-4-deoxy-L-arabinose transferase-like glycosyltransferase